MPREGKGRERRSRWLVALAGGYVLATLIDVVLIRFLVDRFWVATVLAYLPRWLIVLPAPVVLAALLYARDWKLALTVPLCLVAQLFLVGDMHVSFGCPAPTSGRSLRVMSQNADRVPFSTGWVGSLIKDNDLDLLLIQECPVAAEVDVPSPVDGYAFAKDINTCIVSRYPISKADLRPRKDVWDRGGSGAISLYRIDAPFGPISVLNLHLATPRQGFYGFKRFKLGGVATTTEYTELRQWESELAREWSKRADGPLLIMGDFNMPRESAIYKEFWGDFGNAFDACGSGFGYSKETVVKHIEFGTRIDHVLFDDKWQCNSAHLGPEMGSDHRGMIAELSLK